ncbi:MAG: oprF [Gammaproteobacteria bacterium]|jgi:outer membrane protein OmpA-like peptidoglycan-associated protein|nr:oprF [Gammaproteobacteria bacterium]
MIPVLLPVLALAPTPVVVNQQRNYQAKPSLDSVERHVLCYSQHEASKNDTLKDSRCFVVFFDLNKSTLNPKSEETLKYQISQLAFKHCKVWVTGYADRSGKDTYNQDLSEARAATVSHLLQKTGVSVTKTEGYGATPWHYWDLNDAYSERRVEIIIKGCS